MTEILELNGKTYLPASQAARKIGVTRDYVGRLCREGKIVGRRVGPTWYVEAGSLDELLVSQQYVKAKRAQELSGKRVVEYRAHQADALDPEVSQEHPANSLVRISSTVVPPVVSEVVANVPRHILETQQNVAESLRAAGRRVGASPSARAFLEHAPRAVYPTVHAVAQYSNLAHRLFALAFAFAFTFGAYGFVDAQYRTVAIDTAHQGVLAFSALPEYAQHVAMDSEAAARDLLALRPSKDEMLASAASVATLTNTGVQYLQGIWNRAITDTASLTRSLIALLPKRDPNSDASVFAEIVTSKPKVAALTEQRSGAMTVINHPVVERIREIERTVQTTVGGISAQALADSLQQLDNKLSSQIANVTASGNATYQVVAQTNRIDQLSGTDLTNITVHGVSGLAASDIPALSYFAATSTISIAYGGTGTSTAPTYGKMLVGNSLGGYDLLATSTLGVTSSQWTTSGSDIYYTTGSIGIGSTTPLYKLSVEGTSSLGNQAIAGYFTATSSNTSSFAGGLTAYASSTIGNGNQNAGLTISGGATTTGSAYIIGNLGIGTTTPVSKLSVVGESAFAGGGVFGLAYAGTAAPTNGLIVQGNVGFGTSQPLNNFVVSDAGAGGLEINPSLTIGAAVGVRFLSYDRSASAYRDFIFAQDGSYTVIGANGNVGVASTTPWGRLSVDTTGLAAGVPEFTVGSSTRQDFVITQAGNVGIGTTSPAQLLSIGGSLFIGASTAGGTSGGLGVGVVNTTAGTLQTSGAATLGGALTISLGGAAITGAVTGATSYNGLVVTANTGAITTGTWSATAIGPTKGGTGLTAVTTGDLLYGSASNTWASLADVATGNALISGGVGVAPSWGKISLSTAVSGTLQAAQVPAFTGDITTVAGALATTLKSTGTAGTYRSVTFDAQGRETGGTNPTTFAGYGLSDTSANLLAALTDETGTGSAVFSANPTLAGTLTIISAGNSGIEHGRVDGVASTAFIDFHSGATAVDYDSRIAASGGSGVSGGGTLSITAATAAFSGAINTDTIFVTGTGGTGIAVGANNINPATNNVVGSFISSSGYASVNRSAGLSGLFGRTNDGAVVGFYSAGVAQGNISISGATVSYGAFTGSHYALLSGDASRGELMTLTGDNKNYHNDPEAEVLYGVTKSTKENDPQILGAYLALLEPLEVRSVENPDQVMAVGNGDMWVADTGSDLAVGDYLISSAVPGHAEKDPGTDSVSYIIARVAEPVQWSNATSTVNGVKHKKVSVFFENFTRSNGVDLASLIASSTVSATPASNALIDQFFANVFARVTTWLADATNGVGSVFAQAFHAKQEICVDDQCLTKDDVHALLQLAHGQVAAAAGNSGSSGQVVGGSGGQATTTDPTADTTSPTITLTGASSITIAIGDTYSDLGATVTDNVNNNLGYTISLDGATSTTPDQLSLDTSIAGTHTILFSATDQAENTGTATRTVIVGDESPVNPEAQQAGDGAGSEQITPKESELPTGQAVDSNTAPATTTPPDATNASPVDTGDASSTPQTP